MKKDNWETARHYVKWALWQGFEKEIVMSLFDRPEILLTSQEELILRSIVTNRFHKNN